MRKSTPKINKANSSPIMQYTNIPVGLSMEINDKPETTVFAVASSSEITIVNQNFLIGNLGIDKSFLDQCKIVRAQSNVTHEVLTMRYIDNIIITVGTIMLPNQRIYFTEHNLQENIIGRDVISQFSLVS